MPHLLTMNRGAPDDKGFRPVWAPLHSPGATLA
jgi:hypothetical protein